MVKKIIKRLLIGVLAVGSVIGIIIGGYFINLTINDYKPEPIEKIEVMDNTNILVKRGEILKIATSNVGFGGMDKDVHFFLDGGTMSRGISKERVLHNIESTGKLLVDNKVDIALIQEIDIDSTRSYRINQQEVLNKIFKGYDSTLGINFDVPWLLLPLKEPHGEVLAGQATYSNRHVASSERIALPIETGWPSKLLSLDRMFLVNRMPVEGGKELVIMNVHLSAYDKGGLIRKKQLDIVKKYLEEEKAKGNYVILGGDFNQAIPGSDAGKFETEEEWPEWLVDMPEDFKIEGFSWAFDGETPTCRNAGKEYIKGYNFLSIIDGFMVSDNIEVKKVKALDTEFEYSDHNPVMIEIKLK